MCNFAIKTEETLLSRYDRKNLTSSIFRMFYKEKGKFGSVYGQAPQHIKIASTKPLVWSSSEQEVEPGFYFLFLHCFANRLMVKYIL